MPTGQPLARLSFLEATEYGTLRALGMSRAQLTTVGLGRAAAIGAVGGLIAVTVVPLAVLSVMAAVWLAAAALIAVLPGAAATRTRPARVLRGE